MSGEAILLNWVVKSPTRRYQTSMKSFTLVLACGLSLYGASAYSNNGVPIHSYEIDKISEMQEHLNQVLKTMSPQHGVLIFDIDGTLTSKSVPDHLPPTSRGHSFQLVQEAAAKGFHIFAVSAWRDFSHSTNRIFQLGLGREFGMPQLPDPAIQKQTQFIDYTQPPGTPVAVSYFRIGNIISVMDPKADPIHFRQKALAPYIVMKDSIETGHVQYVAFVDDSAGNIGQFKHDVTRFRLYPGARIETFHLGEPIHDPFTQSPHF